MQEVSWKEAGSKKPGFFSDGTEAMLEVRRPRREEEADCCVTSDFPQTWRVFIQRDTNVF